MKFKFPCFISIFPCACSLEEATNKIVETVSHRHSNIRILQAYYDGSQKIILNTHTDGFLYYNSFMPITSIEIREANRKTQISIFFELQKATKILMMLISAVLILFEMALLVLWIMEQLSTFALLFPLSLLFLSYILSNAGLYFSSRGVLRTLYAALACNGIKYMPPIHKLNSGYSRSCIRSYLRKFTEE